MNTLEQKLSTECDLLSAEQTNSITASSYQNESNNPIYMAEYHNMDDPNDKPKTNDEDIITNDEEEDIITNDQENRSNPDIDDDDPLKHLKVL